MAVVTVIVPVYNAHATLRRCINSILNQTRSDFELILVDDGSQDDSFEICRFYASFDNRIKCYTQENAGVSSARNKGLEEATGKYICFVDADDEVEANYLSDLMLQIPDREGNFLILQGLKRISHTGSVIIEQFPEVCIGKSDFVSLFSRYNLSKYGYPVSKLYIRQIIEHNHIRFRKEIIFSEDLIFMIDYLSCIDEVILSHETNYLYYETEGSLTKRIFSEGTERQGIGAFLAGMDHLVQKKCLDKADLLRASASSLHIFMHRILLSIYCTSPKPDRKSRLDSLRRFCDDYGNYLVCESYGFPLHFIVHRLSRRHYVSADILMRLYAFMRFIKGTVVNK